MITRSNNC